MHALMSVPKFYVQVSSYRFSPIILFCVQYQQRIFDVQMLVICVYVFVYLDPFVLSLYSYLPFWKV